jgi:hypothetical protein
MSTASTIWAEALWLLLLALAAVICGVWLIERKHTYLVFIGMAPISIALGMLVEVANATPCPGGGGTSTGGGSSTRNDHRRTRQDS